MVESPCWDRERLHEEMYEKSMGLAQVAPDNPNYLECALALNDALLREFPVPENWHSSDWAELYGRLAADLEKHARRKVISTKQGHKIEYNEMKALLSKAIIDEIDHFLAGHYGFNAAEQEFLVTYDLKYRAGVEDED